MSTITLVLSSVLALASLSGTWGSCPNGIMRQGVNSNEKNIIVNAHNDFRKKIANGQISGQPRGINLKRMSWDDCLAREAQRIANSCIFAHQKATCPNFGNVGQNLYMWMSTGRSEVSDWKGAIASWTNEHTKYRFGSGFSSGTGHYTQVVWANTNKVGCGYSYYKENSGYPYHKLYVCNYGPAGNYIGQNPYKTGNKGCENLC